MMTRAIKEGMGRGKGTGLMWICPSSGKMRRKEWKRWKMCSDYFLADARPRDGDARGSDLIWHDDLVANVRGMGITEHGQHAAQDER
jgi:hypothetical protein